MIYIFQADGVINSNEDGFGKPIADILEKLNVEYILFDLQNDYLSIQDKIKEIVSSKHPVIISGGFVDLLSKEKWYLRTKEFVKDLVQNKIPTLGICFGAQMIYDCILPGNLVIGNVTEVGVTTLSENLFGQRNFFVVHHDGMKYDSNTKIFDEVVIKRVNNVDIIEYFEFSNSNFIGTQFHPEMTVKLFETLLETNSYKVPVEINTGARNIELFKYFLRNAGVLYEK